MFIELGFFSLFVPIFFYSLISQNFIPICTILYKLWTFIYNDKLWVLKMNITGQT